MVQQLSTCGLIKGTPNSSRGVQAQKDEFAHGVLSQKLGCLLEDTPCQKHATAISLRRL